MSSYTVQQISNLTGVSVRTLHHYDEIGLLQPIARTTAGYRLYSYADLLRLQQVLIYRELDIPLKEIALLMDSPAYDRQATLGKQRELLVAKQLHVDKLIKTIDKTLQTFKNGKTMLLEEELFEGLKPEEIAAIQQEVTERWGAEQLSSRYYSWYYQCIP